MGRKDSLSASISLANSSIPAPNSDVSTLVSSFQNVGLTLNDMVSLSGAHTIGRARCLAFSSRLNVGVNPNVGGPEMNADLFESLQQLCSDPNNSGTLAHLDLVTPATFDNQYYVNLISSEGLLQSDQVLVYSDDKTRTIVQSYAADQERFFSDFKRSMLKMGSLAPVTGQVGEIRRNCCFVNEL